MIGHRKIKIWEDNGHIEETEVFLPQIKSIVGFLNGTWDLKRYENCFEGANKLGDIDASIELYGHTLLVEFKRDRKALTAGQLVKAIRQAKHSRITTLFVFGETNNPVEYFQISPNYLKGTGFRKCDTLELSRVFSRWSRWAKQNALTTWKDDDWKTAKQILRSVGGGKNR